MFEEPEAWYEVTPPEPRTSSVFYKVLVIFLILGLMGSALAGVVWLVERRNTASGGRAQLEHSVNRIVFVNLNGQLETVAPDGGDGRLLTSDTLSYQFPAWSPDGKFVAAIGIDALGGGIFLLEDQVGTEAKRVYFSHQSAPIYLYWAPDSRQVSFIASHAQSVLGLFLVGVTGEEESRLLTTGTPFYWNWSAASDEILIHSGFSGEGARLALINAEGSGAGQDIAPPGFFQAPGISADGRYLAYATVDESGINWLVVTDRETGQEQRQRHVGLAALGWSPADSVVAFTSAGREALDFIGPLRLMDAVTGDIRLLSQEEVLAFFWSPDGRYLATITSSGRGNDIVAQRLADPGSGRALHVGKRAQQQAEESFQLNVIDVRDGKSEQLLSFQPSAAFINRFLPFFDQYALSHRLWSPDSDAIVLPVREENRNRIIVAPLDGSPVQLVGEGTMAFWSQN
ncbi:MAG: TolB family protein [Anaerolineae bacterium]